MLAIQPRLQGKVIVITGGASGIGEAAVYHLLREGARVVTGDIQRDLAEVVAHRVQEMGCLDRFSYIDCDVTSETDIIRLIRHARDRFGRIDCMINNAGTGGAFTPILETRTEDWDRTQQVNMRSTFWGTKHAAKAMIEQGSGGSIINVASIAALCGGAGGAAYSASKAAVCGFTRVATAQFGKHRIRCNVVVPGAIVSPLTHRNVDIEEMKRIAADMQPLPIAGEPHHIAPAFAYLASDDAAFVSGLELIVDGGCFATCIDLYSGDHPFGNAIISRARRVGVVQYDHGATDKSNVHVFAESLLETMTPAAPKAKQRILITGVGRGLGRELCLGFQRLGHTIIGCARRSETVAEFRAEFGAPHDFAQVDIANDAQVKAWISDVVARIGAPDLVLNNAAVPSQNTQIWQSTDEDFEKVLGVNVRGTASVCRYVIPPMIRNKTGVIVNFSSGWGRETAAKVSAYCASKWAVEGLTQSIAKELPPFMAIVSLHPGIIQTETLKVSFGESASLYPLPAEWAKVAVPYLLNIGPADNGNQLSVPGMTQFRGMGALPK